MFMDVFNTSMAVFCASSLISTLLFVMQSLAICCGMNPFRCGRSTAEENPMRPAIVFHECVFAASLLLLMLRLSILPHGVAAEAEIALVLVLTSLVVTSLTLHVLWLAIKHEHPAQQTAAFAFAVSQVVYFGNSAVAYLSMKQEPEWQLNALMPTMAVSAVIFVGLWIVIYHVFDHRVRGRRESPNEPEADVYYDVVDV